MFCNSGGCGFSVSCVDRASMFVESVFETSLSLVSPMYSKTNTKFKPTTVAEHFLSHPNHCHTDMQLIPLELIHSSRDSIRKARESFLIDLARTLEPHGMNRRDES